MTAKSRQRKQLKRITKTTPHHDVITIETLDDGSTKYIRSACTCDKGTHHFSTEVSTN